jgi:hypothetical protein
MSELLERYLEMEVLIEQYRSKWEEDRLAGKKRGESYWQGKKDGLRTAMHLIGPMVIDEYKELHGLE